MGTQNEAIDLTAVLKKDGSFDHWQMDYNGNQSGPGSYPAIQIPYGDKADFTVTITNPNPYSDPNKKITFTSKDAIWVAPGTTKPTGPTGSKTKEIHDIKGEGTAVLTFKDHNWKTDNLSYVVNFDNANQLDPIIQNGGGGPPDMQYLIVYLAVGAVALLAITALARRNRLRNKLQSTESRNQ